MNRHAQRYLRYHCTHFISYLYISSVCDMIPYCVDFLYPFIDLDLGCFFLVWIEYLL